MQQRYIKIFENTKLFLCKYLIIKIILKGHLLHFGDTLILGFRVVRQQKRGGYSLIKV